MKQIFLTLIFIAVKIPLWALNPIQNDSLDSELNAHFAIYKPELYRFSGLAFYGEAITDFSEEQISKEKGLYEKVRESGLINSPTKNVFALCHNIIIHSPQIGKEFLKNLNKPFKDEGKINLFFIEVLFSGEFGEQLIVDNLNSDNLEWRKKCSQFLSKNAIYDSSIEKIQKAISINLDTEIKVGLIKSLMCIGSPVSINFVKNIIDTTKNDKIQSASIFVLTELSGYGGIEYIKE